MTRTATGQPAPLPSPPQAKAWARPENNIWTWQSPRGTITLIAEFDRVVVWHGPAVVKVINSQWRTRNRIPSPRFVWKAMEWAEARFAK